MRSSSATDLELLRSYEPVLRFTAGELFFPAAVESYIGACSLWETNPTKEARQRVPAGQLDVPRLIAESTSEPAGDLSMRFVDVPLGRRELRAWRQRPGRPAFRSGGRFTRVGLLARVIDLLFRAALLLRGRVPGGLAAAAEIAYRTKLDPTQHPYYGHVTRDGGYVALQYWFFYAMNDWRSTFTGANDHEADWEQVTVYLAEQPGGDVEPTWVALSSHDYVGDDLRRRWDDPDLVRDGDHPVVFVGAGSHSGAYIAGDYVTAVDPPGALHRVLRVLQAIARVLTPWARGEIARGVGIPFIDYARGDGQVIGPHASSCWVPVVIDDHTPWVVGYRGLWGLETRDRFGGERAPAGPRYERGGSIRRSWIDPIGWSGLDKVPSSTAEVATLLRRRAEAADDELASVRSEISERRAELRSLGVATKALERRGVAAEQAFRQRAQIATLEGALEALNSRRVDLDAQRAAIAQAIESPAPLDHPQAHLTRKAMPVGDGHDVRRRFLRVWSTISTPLLFLAAAVLAFDDRVGVVVGVVAFIVVFVAFEAIARRHFLAFLTTLSVLAFGALIAVVIAANLLGRWQSVLGVVLLVGASATLLFNLRELRRG